MEKISIIIPVYNVEKYIRKSLDSVLNQTYKNLEIILVDDGSKDLSGNICDEYCKKDQRIKVIHKENGGLSSARNAGLDVATGKYVMFLDSDDYFENNSCEVLYNEIEKKKADYVIGNYIHVTHDGVKWDKPLFDINIYDNFKISIEDYKKSFFVMNSVVWNKIFKREFIEKHNLRFIHGALAEDAIFTTYCYVHSDKGYYINDIVYNYRQNEENVSISTNCTKNYFAKLNESYKLIFNNFETTNNIGFYRFFYARIMPYLLCKIIDTNALKDDNEIIEVFKMLKWFFKQKEIYNVAIMNDKLAEIVENINNENYIEALTKLKETKQYRNSISDVEKEKMYAPSKELYKKMSGMKVTFYSNFLTHHQIPFCLEMQKKLGDNFKFVSTVKIFQWRLDMGFKDLDQKYDFVVRAYEDDKQYEEAKKLAIDSDIVIIGSTTDELIEERLKQDKITFRYRARIFIFLDGFFKTIFDKEKMQLFWNRHIKYRKNKNLHLLCANAYGANDFNLFRLYKDKIYKWGYFLEINKYNIDKLIEQKEKNGKIELIWVARFIKWKHPEIVIKLAKNLKKQNYNFHIKMLGAGPLENKIKETIKKENLEDVIEVVGQVPSENVKEYMEKANIFIGTSDSREGWGAVINESMNAACTVIANQKMGSVPFLIKHRENGLMYNTYNELEKNVKEAIVDKDLRKKLGKNAYKTITEDWTSEIAAKNLIELFENILNGKKNTVNNGPASNAQNYKKKRNLV